MGFEKAGEELLGTDGLEEALEELGYGLELVACRPLKAFRRLSGTRRIGGARRIA